MRLARLAAAALALVPVLTAPAVVEAAPWQVDRSDVFSLAASDGHAYRIAVAWPDGEPPAEGWPVLWVLDGEDNFAITVMTARRLARAGARSGVEPGVIVAVDSGPLARRVLDYTPHVPGYAIPAGLPAHGLATGGSDAFLAFLEREIRPAVLRRWRIDPKRETLLGHSFGGLLALHALAANRPFSGYVAISPSLWFGNGAIAREFARTDASAPARRLMIAEGDTPNPSGGRSRQNGSTLPAFERIPSLRVEMLALPGQSHGTTFLAAIAPAIGFAFGRVDQ